MTGAPASAATVTVVAPGPLTTVQDRGRPGFSDWGVGVSGAADRGASALANRLVGNPVDAAVLEVTAGGLVIRASGRVRVAVTGAAGPVWRRRRAGRGRPPDRARAVDLDDGDELGLGPPGFGLRSYVAIRGGVDVAPVLGSRSTDLLAGVGPAPLRAGDVLPVGAADAGGSRSCLVAGTDGGALAPAPVRGEVTLDAVLGPRADWFTAGARHALFTRAWAVTSQCDRVGVRLQGPALERAPGRLGRELPSEGVARGAIQVPAGGQPLVFLADHPVTGGYPVVAVLTDRDADRAAQLSPGQTVRLRPAPGSAHRLP